MREILFRGKTEKGEWKYGYLYITHNGEYEVECYNETVNIERVTHIVIPETVGQYAGLTDKNGKKIFEGDIVHLTDVRYDNEWTAVVTFGNPYCQYSWGWNLHYIGKKPQINTDILLWVEREDGSAYCEIIGNIHDNLELLKGGEE